jgi:hypothetical protein
VLDKNYIPPPAATIAGKDNRSMRRRINCLPKIFVTIVVWFSSQIQTIPVLPGMKVARR